jgi:sodium-dependent dicarboxylate transporter 2/3/5
MWVSNTATTLMMLPIGLSVLALVAERSGESLETAAPGTTTTGPATSTSSRREHQAVRRLPRAGDRLVGEHGRPRHPARQPAERHRRRLRRRELGRTIGFVEWMMVGLPIALAFILIAGC